MVGGAASAGYSMIHVTAFTLCRGLFRRIRTCLIAILRQELLPRARARMNRCALGFPTAPLVTRNACRRQACLRLLTLPTSGARPPPML